MGKKIQKIIRQMIFGAVMLASGMGVVFAQNPDTIKSLFVLGQKAYEQKEYQKAIDYFEQIIEENNDFAPAYQALGLIYQEISSDPNYPLWYFETAIQINPSYAPAYDMLCRSYYQLQKYDQAERMCQQALDLDPNLAASQLSMAWIYLNWKVDPDRAIYYFQKVSSRVKSPVIFFGLGMAYVMNGNHGKALDMITQLRLAGEEDFASHLESILRSKTPAEKFIPSGYVEKMSAQMEAQAKQQEQAAQASAQAYQQGGVRPVPVPVIVAPKITGGGQVHIKGKIRPPQIQGMQGYSQPKSYGGQSEPHPGGLSDN